MILLVLLLLFTTLQHSLSQQCSTINFCSVCINDHHVCEQCEEGFKINKNNQCQQSLCQNNQYLSQQNQCVSRCPSSFIENESLQVCDSINKCSQRYEIGQETLPFDTAGYLVIDAQHSLIFNVADNMMNIRDAKTFQFLTKITISIPSVTLMGYNAKTQIMGFSNGSGMIELWDIQSVVRIKSTQYDCRDSSDIKYIPQNDYFYCLCKSGYICKISMQTGEIYQLNHKMTSLSINLSYFSSTNCIVFTGQGMEILEIKLDSEKLSYYNPFSNEIDLHLTKGQFVDDVVYYFNLVRNYMNMYQTDAKTLALNISFPFSISSLFTISKYYLFTQRGTSITSFFMVDASFKQFIKISQDLSYPFAYLMDNKKKVLLLNASITQQAITDLDLSPEAIKKQQILTNYRYFEAKVTQLVTFDDALRYLVFRYKDMSLMVYSMDTLSLLFVLKQFDQKPYVNGYTAILGYQCFLENYCMMSYANNLRLINTISNEKTLSVMNPADYPFNKYQSNINDEYIILATKSAPVIYSLTNMQLQKQITSSLDAVELTGCTTFTNYGSQIIAICKKRITKYSYITDSFQEVAFVTHGITTISLLLPSTDTFILCSPNICYIYTKSDLSKRTLFDLGTNKYAGVEKFNTKLLLLTTKEIIYVDIETTTQIKNSNLCEGITALQSYNEYSVLVVCTNNSVVDYADIYTEQSNGQILIQRIQIPHLLLYLYYQKEGRFFVGYETNIQTKTHIYIYQINNNVQLIELQNIFFPSQIVGIPLDEEQNLIYFVQSATGTALTNFKYNVNFSFIHFFLFEYHLLKVNNFGSFDIFPPQSQILFLFRIKQC